MRRALALVIALTCLPSAVAHADTSAPVVSGLRGVRATAPRCDLITVNGDDLRITGTIRSFRVCPTPGVNGTTGAAVLVSRTKRSVAFRALRSALAAADGVSRQGEICPMYADVYRQVYVVTSKGTWLMHLPVDSCRHYTQAVQRALGLAQAA